MRVIAAIALAFVSLLAGCAPGGSYTGDGRFVALSDYPFANYAITFNVPTSPPDAKATFHFSGLPEIESTVGLRIQANKGMDCEQAQASAQFADAMARIVLRENGREVATMSGAVREWRWNHSLGSGDCYLYGETSYFEPDDDAKYELDVQLGPNWPNTVAAEIEIRSFAVYTP